MVQWPGYAPAMRGMGSGAAVSTAIVRGLGKHFGHWFSSQAVSDLVYETEKIYHGTPSGIDNTVVAFEKPVYFVKNEIREVFWVAEPFLLAIADTGIEIAKIQKKLVEIDTTVVPLPAAATDDTFENRSTIEDLHNAPGAWHNGNNRWDLDYLLKVWDGLSSYGGFLGALIGGRLASAAHIPRVRPLPTPASRSSCLSSLARATRPRNSSGLRSIRVRKCRGFSGFVIP